MSDAPEAWRSAVSFSERFATIQKISSSLSQHKGLAAPEARLEATLLEKTAFEDASTLEEYQITCQPQASTSLSYTEDDERHEADDHIEDVKLSPSAEILGKYAHAHHYKSGLFSFVYRAPNPHADGDRPEAFVALKVTTPSMMEEPHDSEREARILALARHKNIIPLDETFRMAGGRFVLVFPFMPYSLEGLLERKRLSPRQAKSTLRDLFSALAFLHGHGMIHRDVKPSNILLKSLNGPAYLSDFGIAWSPNDANSEDPSQKITDVGTTAYRPPELLFGHKAYGCSLDLWAAGCVVAEAASLATHTLFTAGDLGSELALINSIFNSLGTPSVETWPEAASFPDWGKMQWKQFPAKPWSKLVPNAMPEARDLISKLVVYESGRRVVASEALEHPYLAS